MMEADLFDAVATPPEAPDGAIWKHVRILVVEDDPAARELFVEALRLMNLWETVEIVKSGTVLGAEMALKSGPKFDVILLDLNLPNGRGLEVIYRLSRAQAFPPAIVVLTGMEFDISHEVQGIREGAATWLRKSDLITRAGRIDWSPLERSIGYSLARRDWLGPMLIERSRRIAAEGVRSG